MVNRDDIQHFLALFDGDVDRAVQAITSYTRPKMDQYVASDKPVILEAIDLTKSYKMGKVKVDALKGVSLNIHEGEFVAITGESGSGKSTLLQLLGGLDKPTSGEVKIDGVSLRKLRDGQLSTFRGQTVGFVFQSFYLQPFLRLATNIEVVGMFARTSRSERSRRVRELAKLVGLSDRLKHYPRELSGGQTQRASIARALLNRPKIIIADEPTGNLDSENGSKIIELFETIRRDLGTTIILVTHDTKIAARADRIIRLKDGAVL